MRWLVLVMLAACGRIGFDAIDGDGGGSGDGGGTDFDNDGFVGAADNCPDIANADQADEDHDAVGDVCDPCPISADNSDADQDGVGGPCDTRPASPTESIAFFSGFSTMPMGMELAGTWSLSGGQIHVTGALNSLAAATVVSAGPDAEVVFTRVTIDALFGNGVARPIGVVHHFNAQNMEGTVCVFGIDPSNNEIYALADNETTTALATAPTAANVGDSSTFESTRVGINYSCDAERLSNPLTSSNSIPVTNRAGLFARSGSATFDYLLIVKRGT